jgi:uncharacterized membrane protein YdcZ (DUF606 family)
MMNSYISLIIIAVVGGVTFALQGQFITAARLDHFGVLGVGAVMRPLDLSRLLGFGVLIFGVWLIMR